MEKVHVHEKNFYCKIRFSLHKNNYRWVKSSDPPKPSMLTGIRKVIQLKYNCFHKRLIWICCPVKSNISKKKKNANTDAGCD